MKLQHCSVQISTPSIDCAYIRTLGGIMKCVCIALCLLTFLCVLIGGPGYYSGAGWATFVSSVGLCLSTSLLFLYLFRVVDALPQVPWIVGEMCFCFAWTIFYFIAACVLAVAAARFAATGGWAVAAMSTILASNTPLVGKSAISRHQPYMATFLFTFELE
ncbi:unnamed protein product [Heligmosomoides polygyrus]|uniref:MARVEL domain-containing protein n=1 Tax=Heligmosomoides polygyrus TaxID=6339 RepID=A0A183FIC2_HELPZ|nr:unnamed protein product [Heligmosomoides polygyrus]